MTVKLKDKERSSERRKAKRLYLEPDVGIAIASRPLSFLSRRPTFRGVVRNASVCGFLLHVEQNIAYGELLALWVEVEIAKERRTLRLLGDVMWCNQADAMREYLVGVYLQKTQSHAARMWRDVMVEEIAFSERR